MTCPTPVGRGRLAAEQKKRLGNRKTAPPPCPRPLRQEAIAAGPDCSAVVPVRRAGSEVPGSLWARLARHCRRRSDPVAAPGTLLPNTADPPDSRQDGLNSPLPGAGNWRIDTSERQHAGNTSGMERSFSTLRQALRDPANDARVCSRPDQCFRPVRCGTRLSNGRLDKRTPSLPPDLLTTRTPRQQPSGLEARTRPNKTARMPNQPRCAPRTAMRVDEVDTRGQQAYGFAQR
jgi:hypothetical protein